MHLSQHFAFSSCLISFHIPLGCVGFCLSLGCPLTSAVAKTPAHSFFKKMQWWDFLRFFLSFLIQTIIYFQFSQENSLGKGEYKPTCLPCFPEEAENCGISADDTMVTSRMMLGPRQAERDHIILSLDRSLGIFVSKEHHKGWPLSY